jgi:hypothetical protein
MNFSHVLTAEAKKIFKNFLRHLEQREVIESSTAIAGIIHLRARLQADRSIPATTAFKVSTNHAGSPAYRRGGGLGRGLEAGLGLAVGVALGVGVGVGVGVREGVGVDVAVAVGVGVGVDVPPTGATIATIIGEPVLK